jgi:four helix bundle protein
MSGLQHAESFRELEVYKRSWQVSREVFQATTSFPREEAYSLTDQVRRSSRSVGAQIAEAWGKRRYQKHFVSKLTDADAEQIETQHWLGIAADCNYLSIAEGQKLIDELTEIGRMLHGMINKAHKFCSSETDH